MQPIQYLLTKISCFVSLLAAIGMLMPAHSAQALNLKRTVALYAKSSHIPAVEVSIMRKGRVDESVYVGYGNLEYRQRLTKDSIFRIASVSKQFTAQAIMILAEQNKLAVSDTLSKYLPDFPKGDQITISNLLQHTSGVADFADDASFSGNQAREWTPQELVALAAALPFQFEPGSSANYCNTNFVILGLIIESASAMSYSDFLKRNIFRPLKMNATRVGSDSAIIANRVDGYEYQDGAYKNVGFVSVVAPFATGDLMSRTRDFVRLASSYRTGQSPFFKAATIQQMTTPAVLSNGSTYIDPTHHIGYDTSFGYGMELIRPVGEQNWIITKSGSIDGFKLIFAYFRGSDTAIAIAGNSTAAHFDFLMKLAKRMKLKA